MRNSRTWVTFAIGWMCAVVCAGAKPLDTEMIETGDLPADVRVETTEPAQLTLRAIREYAPCVRLHVRQKQPWTLLLGGATPVEAGKTHTAAIMLASAVDAGQSQTIDIANFRPENQQKTEEKDVSGNGTGELLIVDGKDPARVLARAMFAAGNWNPITVKFDAPADVSAVSLRLTSATAGVFFVADADVVAGSESLVLFRPDDSTLAHLQGEQKEFATLIEPGRKYNLYEPGQTISWKVAKPGDAFSSFRYRILDPLGNVLDQGEKEFPATVEYQPADVGYYELVIVSQSTADASRAVHDWQGAAVLTPVGPFEPGQTAFGAQCAPHDLMKIVGATWDRAGFTGWTTDVNELDANHDYSERIASFRDNGVLPLHAQNNITSKTNSYPPGKENELPSDLENYEQAYRKLASLGGNFVEHFEFWNEPEGRLGATPHWTIENLAKTVQAAHRGMKSANPNAKLAIGNNLDLVAGIQKHAGSDCFEMVTLHPYPWGLGFAWNTPEDGLLLEASISARQWLDNNDGKDKELWSTEYGYTTGTTEGGCSFLQQAQMNVRATLLQLGGGYDKVNPFRMDDVWYWGQVDGRFGFCLQNYTPKPSLVAYAAMIRAIRDLKFVGRFDAPKNVAAFVFGNDAESVIAIWTDRQDQTIEVNLPAGGKRMDLFGRVTDLPPGVQPIVATQSTQYLIVPQAHAALAAAQPPTMPFLAGLHGGVFDAKVDRKTYEIPILTAAPTLDGDLAEWRGPAMVLADRSEDFTSNVRAAFHGDALYISGQVRGRTPGKNPQSGINIWDGDCIEVYFSRESDNRPIGYYREIDKHIGVAPGVDGSTGQAANIVPNHPPDLPGAEVRYKPHAQGGYDLEARIPLKLLDVTEPIKPGDGFAFDIQLSVGDPATHHRRHQATWSGTSQNHLNPFAWGSAVAVEERKPVQLGWTMGTWPDGLHNTGLRAITLELDEPAWREDFRLPDATSRLYAIVGAWVDNWATYVWHDAQAGELTLGGDAPHLSGHVIWKFSAPKGNALAGGRVTVDVTPMVDEPPAGETSDLFAAVGTRLELDGGGDYFKGFKGYNSDAFARAAIDPRKGRQQVSLEIPAGAGHFFLAVSRAQMADRWSRLVVHGISVEPKFRDENGLTIRFNRNEPLWSVGEEIKLRVSASGDAGVQPVAWKLTRRDGQVHRAGEAPVANGSAVVDLSDAHAGFYALTVAAGSASAQTLDAQDLVILRAQDPTVTHENSIFGGHGAFQHAELAQRMGIKWSQENFQWAWRQRSPESPIDLGPVSSYAKMRAIGMEPIIGIDTAPPWANGGKDVTVPPLEEFYPQWEAFNQAIASATRGTVTWFETWNEPNNPGGMTWDPADVQRKAKEVQRHQFKGLMRGNPDAKLIGGRFAGIPADWFAAWLRQPLSVRKFQHAMSGHSYCRALPEEGFTHKYPPEPTLVPELLAARKAMDTNGAKDQPMFWTEYGWKFQEITEDQHARWLSRHQVIMNAYCEKTRTLADCLFGFGNFGGYDVLREPRDVEPGQHRFKPVIGAYATTASLLAGTKPLEPISDYPKPLRAYRFQKGKQTIYALWATEETQTRQMKLPISGKQTVTRVNLLGDESVQEFDFAKPYPVPANHDPVFLIVGDVR